MTKPLNELTVVQANDFIQQTNWAMDKVPLKLFKSLIAAIDIKNPPKDNTVVVSKAELIKLLDTSGHNYVYLKRRMRQLVTSVKVDDADNEEHYVALVQDIYWKIDSDEVKVKFHEAVMPYLIGLKSRFLQYPAATEDINQAGVEILVKNEKVKRGRKIVNINFYVRARNSYRDTEFDVINVRPDQIREFLK